MYRATGLRTRKLNSKPASIFQLYQNKSHYHRDPQLRNLNSLQSNTTKTNLRMRNLFTYHLTIIRTIIFLHLPRNLSRKDHQLLRQLLKAHRVKQHHYLIRQNWLRKYIKRSRSNASRLDQGIIIVSSGKENVK